MKIGIIIQARLNSTRFPKKVLAPIYRDKTVIEEIIDRAKKVRQSSGIVVATSDSESDGRFADFLKNKTDVAVFRGSENNVLSRYVAISKSNNFDHIVRLTGDNACIDPNLIEDTIKQHIAGGFDYSYTVGYPLGTNIEVIACSALYAAAKDGKTPPDQEHVTYFVRNNPQRFKLNFILADLPTEFKDLRLTFDTAQDYLQIRILFDYLQKGNDFFTMSDILKLWKSNPYVFQINSSIFQKTVYSTEAEELKAAQELLEKQEMNRAAEIIKSVL
jgi:spore coat polysaccharide biosynthesis protein SpsF